MRRVIEERSVLAEARKVLAESDERRLSRAMRAKLLQDRLEALLKEAPLPDGAFPECCGLAEAAEILGTTKQYVRRLKMQGDLPAEAQFQSGPVFRLSTVMAKAKELNDSRTAREKAREEREKAATG